MNPPVEKSITVKSVHAVPKVITRYITENIYLDQFCSDSMCGCQEAFTLPPHYPKTLLSEQPRLNIKMNTMYILVIGIDCGRIKLLKTPLFLQEFSEAQSVSGRTALLSVQTKNKSLRDSQSFLFAFLLISGRRFLRLT